MTTALITGVTGQDGTLLADGVLLAAQRNNLACVFIDGYWGEDWDPIAVLSRKREAIAGLVHE